MRLLGSPAVYPGSFLATLTGMTTTTTGTVNYVVANGLCTLTSVSGLGGTSSSTFMAMMGLPPVCQPASAVPTAVCGALVSNGAGSILGACQVSGSTITFNLMQYGGNGYSPTGFATTNTKGVQAGWTITYPLT